MDVSYRKYKKKRTFKTTDRRKRLSHAARYVSAIWYKFADCNVDKAMYHICAAIRSNAVTDRITTKIAICTIMENASMGNAVDINSDYEEDRCAILIPDTAISSDKYRVAKRRYKKGKPIYMHYHRLVYVGDPHDLKPALGVITVPILI